MDLNPYEGGKIAVAEAARNVVCSGAKPLAITNCLNFGNPTKPQIFWQFKKCVEGMAESCILNSNQKIGAIIALLPFYFPFSLRANGLLFGETQSRIVISCHPENFNQIRDLAHKNKAPFVKLGRVEGDRLIINIQGKKLIDIGVDELDRLWRSGLSRHI